MELPPSSGLGLRGADIWDFPEKGALKIAIGYPSKRNGRKGTPCKRSSMFKDREACSSTLFVGNRGDAICSFNSFHRCSLRTDNM